ncbi:hypothetical protein ABIA31_000023 [Catenulispora sp. MAP5-51]|uniref:glycan biosynthesis hexose transferase WsfD n=1 Tax=Catenulispora sp. MAP5-51 TaxID=3156298 RepID=UPI003518C323
MIYAMPPPLARDAYRLAVTQLDRKFAPETVGLVAALAMAARLLFPTPVTMADNGDGRRLLCVIHAAPSSRRWAFAVIHYGILKGQKCDGYATIQAVPLIVASWMDQNILGRSEALDARELILPYCMIVGVVIAITLRTLSGISPAIRTAFAAALFIVAADAAFADYAGSPYTETAALYGVLIFAVAAVAFVGRETHRLPAFLLAWFGALLIVGAKTETATLAVPLCLFFAFRKIEIRRFSNRLGSRALPALCVGSILMTALWVLGAFSPDGDIPLEKVNVSNEVTMTVMPLSKDPGGVAVDLGLPRRFGAYSGSNWWSEKSIPNDPEYAAISGKLTQVNLAHYFAMNPAMSAKIFTGGAKAYLSFRNDYIGTYDESADHPAGTQEQRMILVTDISRAFRSFGISAIICYWGFCGTAAVWLFRRSAPNSKPRGFALVAGILLSFAVLQYFVSIYGDGNEVTKHLVVGLLAASIAPLWLAASAVCLRYQGRSVPTRTEARPRGTERSVSPAVRRAM